MSKNIMKAKISSVTIHVYEGEPDWMNNTFVYLNSAKFWPVYDDGKYLEPNLELSPGDEFVLSIPSGKLSGTVKRIGENSIVLGEVTWDGKAEGLAGGLSGFGNFEFVRACATVVESSAMPQGGSMPYIAYENLRALVGWMAAHLDVNMSPGKKGDVMAAVYKCIMDELHQ